MQKFDTPAAVSAALDVPAGRIQVIAADRTDTTVDVRPADASKSRDVKAAEQTEVEFTDGVLRIKAPAGKTFGPSGSIEVTVQVPTGSHLEAKAAATEFRGVGRLGDIAFEGAHGAVKIDEAANVRLTAHAGDITVGRLTGSADITAQQGSITITEAVSGSIVLKTQVGDLTIGAAPGVSATLNAGTTVGRVDNTLKNTGGTADLTIHATTTTGNITARSL